MTEADFKAASTKIGTIDFDVVEWWRMKYSGGVMTIFTLRFVDGTSYDFRQDDAWSSTYRSKEHDVVAASVKKKLIKYKTNNRLTWH